MIVVALFFFRKRFRYRCELSRVLFIILNVEVEFVFIGVLDTIQK